MKFLFDNIPIAIVIAGICMLMLYPYIGAGLLLAALCFEAEQYVLMVISFLICILMQSIMGRRIRPYHVPVKPSRASRRKRRKKKSPAHAVKEGGAQAGDAEAGDTSEAAKLGEDAEAASDEADAGTIEATDAAANAGNTEAAEDAAAVENAENADGEADGEVDSKVENIYNALSEEEVRNGRRKQ